MLYLLLVFFGIAPYVSGQACGHFDYAEPDVEWPALSCPGKINQCDKQDNLLQSPVVIMSGQTTSSLKPLDWHGYVAFSGVSLNNGHTLSVKAPTNYSGGFKDYYLMELHLHTPAENVLYANGREALTIHFVHQNPTTGALAVLALTFRVVPSDGVTFNWLKPIIDAVPQIPLATNTTPIVLGSLQPFFDNLRSTKNDAYYNFNGSLTTPPCTQGVEWHFLETTEVVSEDDLKIISSVSFQNNRPVQRIISNVPYYTYRTSLGHSLKNLAFTTFIVVITVLVLS